MVAGGSVAGVVVLSAPAKITLSLRVVGLRPDGYHLIDAEMVTVDLADLVELTPPGPSGTSVSVVEGQSAPEWSAPHGVGVVPLGADNLVARALVAVGTEATVRLHKRIPAGAGLGGGSADAAAVLRWAGVRDPEVAVRLGADVPFCVVGGRARVGGVGEDVEPLEHRDDQLTLCTPPLGCSTPAVYAAWDDLGGPTAPGPNDLEPAALRVEPRLAKWRDALGDATGCTPVLAGSGSTWFVHGAHPGEGRVVVRTVPSGWQAPGADA